MSGHTKAPHVLVVVQNLSVPLDRRVWLECRALRSAGYDVSVICPRGEGEEALEELDGVRIHRYRPAPPAAGAWGYAWEFAYCWLRTAQLSARVWRRRRFDVLQACNPPDTYWALARLWRLRGVRFVFDHHDLNPELFESRFGAARSIVARAELAALRGLERATYSTADRAVTTNDSYRRRVLARDAVDEDKVVVVRSGPDTRQMRPRAISAARRQELAQGRPHLACYLGIMGPQDGVDVVVRAVDVLVHRMGRDDVHVALLGFGDCLAELQTLARDLGLGPADVTFTGRADQRTVAEYLSAAALGISPDPMSPLNDVSTMNKTMEYMAFALPVIATDLHETRVSAGEAALYVTPGDHVALARAVAELLDSPERRRRMAALGRSRASSELDWAQQAGVYVRLFDELLGRPPRGQETVRWTGQERRSASAVGPLVDAWGSPLLDLRQHLPVAHEDVPATPVAPGRRHAG